MNLFDVESELFELRDETGVSQRASLRYWPAFLTPRQASLCLQQSLKEIPWSCGEVVIAGKILPIPRLQSWIADENLDYTYSGKKLVPNPWPVFLKQLKADVEAISGHQFNSVLANWYRDGKDGVGWHADDERELGQEPIVASVSLGAERRFCLKPKHKGDKARFEISPVSGSLLIMNGKLQKHWVHSVPKTSRPVEGRVSLTFRKVDT